MSQKIAKALRWAARRAMKKSPKLTGHTAHSKPTLDFTKRLGGTEKQARRASRLAAQKLSRPVPGWALRLVGIRGRIGLFPAQA